MSRKVEEYFKDSEAVLINTPEGLHDYVSNCIEAGYCGIDTETTGLDRIQDSVVGFSLYYPGGHECYVPNKHRVYIFDDLCKGQLTYEECGNELQRLVDAKVKMIFANADFDLSMIYKDFKVDMCDAFYYDVILAWRCLKENEKRNGLKELYSKYVLKGKGDPMKFSDFFSVDLFPYCKPQIAKLYAANDARITYELFKWQLPYTVPSHPKCQKNHLERISELIWNLEFPMVKVCAMMHRNGVYFDMDVARKVGIRYHSKYDQELADLRSMVQDLIDDMDTPNNRKRPFKTGMDFMPTSPKHVQYLCYDLLNLPDPSGKQSTDKGILRDFGLPQTDKILAVRSLSVLINSFVDKLTRVSQLSDGRIHAQFRSVGADTGRMSCISEGTMISCPGGDKPIEDMNPGDWVYCYNVDTNNLQISRVEGKYMTGIRKCIKLNWKSKYDSNLSGSLVCTPDHFLRTQDGRWVMAKDLKLDDFLLYVYTVESQEHGKYVKASFGQVAVKNDELVKTYFSYPYNSDNRESKSNDRFEYVNTFNGNQLSDHISVHSIELIEDPCNVYDLCIEEHHNFIAGNLCVHNSSEPNAQNIPSHATDIRHMFRATPEKNDEVESVDNTFTVSYYDRVETPNGFVPAGKLELGDVLVTDEGLFNVTSVSINGSEVSIRIVD